MLKPSQTQKNGTMHVEQKKQNDKSIPSTFILVGEPKDIKTEIKFTQNPCKSK